MTRIKNFISVVINTEGMTADEIIDSRVFGGPDIIGFDPRTGVLTDRMGFPRSRAQAERLIQYCQQHLKHSDLELEALDRRRQDELDAEAMARRKK
jgi:hypothetical protein